MPNKTLPIIITNDYILIKDKESETFKSFSMPGIEPKPNIPFFHEFAKKINECQYYFKQAIRAVYGKKTSKYILAIITPDDTSPLESIFINEFFVNSGTCKAVAQTTISQVLSKEHKKYISISKTCRNVVLQYINNNEIEATMSYDCTDYDVNQIAEDAKRLHIDVEYADMPVFINNLNLNMSDFGDVGIMLSPRQILDKIAGIDVEKI